MTLTHLPFNLALARIEQIGYARCVSFESRSLDGDRLTQVANVSMCEPSPRAAGFPAEPCKPRGAGSEPADSLQHPLHGKSGEHRANRMQLHRSNRQTWKPRSAESRAKKAIWSKAYKARKKLEQQALALESES
jgi:hypothetical protein